MDDEATSMMAANRPEPSAVSPSFSLCFPSPLRRRPGNFGSYWLHWAERGRGPGGPLRGLSCMKSALVREVLMSVSNADKGKRVQNLKIKRTSYREAP